MPDLSGLETLSGTNIAIAVDLPTTEDAAGYEALTWVEITGIETFGEWGDTENDVAVNFLSAGRIVHLNGLKDGGEIEMAVHYVDSDAGSTLIIDNAGSDAQFSVRKLYKSGDAEYSFGVFTSPKYRSGDGDTVRGYSGMFRSNAKVVPVAAT